VFLVRHGRVFPCIEKLARQLGALAAGFIAFLVDRAIVYRASLHAEVCYVEGNNLNRTMSVHLKNFFEIFTAKISY